MRRSVCLLLILLTLIVTSCSGKTSDLSDKFKEENQAKSDFKTVFTDALENRDRDSIRELFSQEARLKCQDLDTGIDYVFDLCGGNKIEPVDEHSSTLDKPGSDKELNGYLKFKSGDKTYAAKWKQFLGSDTGSSTGVYQLYVYEYDEGMPYTCSAAGIYHPGIRYVNDSLRRLYELYRTDHSLTDTVRSYKLPDESVWSDLFDPDVYKSLDQKDKDSLIRFYLHEDDYSYGPGMIWHSDDGVIYHNTITYHKKACGFLIRYNKAGKIMGIAVDGDNELIYSTDDGIHGFRELYRYEGVTQAPSA